MNSFSLTRADIRVATSWGYSRCRALIEHPYRLESCIDPAGRSGGGSVERFRLGDALSRLKIHKNFTPEMEQKLIAADAAFRKGTRNERIQ